MCRSRSPGWVKIRCGSCSGMKTHVMEPSETEQRRTCMRSGRTWWVAAGCIATTLLLSGCAGATSSDRPQARESSSGSTGKSLPLDATTSLDALTFRHPSSWQLYPYTYESTFGAFLGELSTQPLQDPCTVQTASGLVCGQPINPLKPNAVVITWTRHSPPLGTGTPWDQGVQGSPAKFAGLEARVESGAAESWCAQINGSRQLIVTLNRGHGGLTIMTACMSAPGVAVTEGTVQAMLASLTVAQ